MSIDRMISLHPDVHGDLDAPLATAARHAMFCAVMGTSCADARSAEDMDMRQCIRSCSDCADICQTTARIAVRRTGENVAALRAVLEACATVCELCAAECARHDHEHGKLCETMCRECADDCRTALATL